MPKAIFYKGQKYDGVLIHPIDSKVNDNIEQQTEFATVVLNTLTNQGRLRPSQTANNSYSMIVNKDSDTIVEIKSENDKLRFLCKFVPIYFPALKDVCKYNDIAQKMFKEGGLYGLKDPSIIENLLYIIENSVVFGENQFPTVIDKATQIWYKIARYQAFNNGNKRTALLTTVMFLMLNQLFFDFDSSNMKQTLYDISVKIASEKYQEKDIKEFILKNVKVDFDLMNMTFFKKMGKK